MTPLDPEHEKDIINRLRDDDGRAMVPIFKLYHRSLFYFAKQMVSNEEQAEDLVADTFLKLWQKRTEFEDLESIKAFMIVALRNASLNHLKHIQRKTASHKEILHSSELNNDYIEAKMIKANLLQIIFQEVESLPPIRRKIFKMIFLEDLSIFEIASRLNVTTDTVRVQKARAIHALRTAILKKGIVSDAATVAAGLLILKNL
jgi:RNA polymerase sigma-70 factor (ECF subfamily)